MFDDYFERAQALMAEGVPFATAVIVYAQKPTSGKVGDKAIITADGELHGWIGGSCAQPTVSKEGVRAIKEGEEILLRLSPNPAEMAPRAGVTDLPMTCFSGGTLEIYIEPQYPKPRLIVIGDMSVAQVMVSLGKVMSYDVVAVDPDGDGSTIKEAHHVLSDLGQVAEYARADTYVVIATHGQFDEVAVEHALKTNADYIGLVASKKRFENVLDYLRSQGAVDETLKRLKAPAGLDIQAKRGDEIALSIMAQIIQTRRNRAEAYDLEAFQPQPVTAVDPVCGMNVDIATAEHTYVHQGETFYFCCEGCRETFAKDPENFKASDAPTGDAIDPVCGMTVDIKTAKYMSEYQGEMVYFCAAGCKMRFDEDPESYIENEAPSGVATDPVCGMSVDIRTAEHMSEYQGEVYYFCGAGCKATFEENPEKFIEKQKA